MPVDRCIDEMSLYDPSAVDDEEEEFEDEGDGSGLSTQQVTLACQIIPGVFSQWVISESCIELALFLRVWLLLPYTPSPEQG